MAQSLRTSPDAVSARQIFERLTSKASDPHAPGQGVERFHPLKSQPVRLDGLEVGWVRLADDGGIEIRIGTDAGLGSAPDLADLAERLSAWLLSLKARHRG